MNLSNRALVGLIALLLVLCLLTTIAYGIVLGDRIADFSFDLALFAPTAPRAPTATPTGLPTRAPPTATNTPAPTYTPVIRLTTTAIPPTRAPTLAANPYNIVVPTPSAPAIINPVTFNSSFQVVTYSVSGRTTTELTRVLDAQAIPDPRAPGNRYYALTEWRISADWQLRSSTRGCELDRANVLVQITMTLPALTTRQGLAPDLLTRWDRFLANTITHEKGHVTRTLSGVRDYQRALGNLAAQPTCVIMHPMLDNLFKQHLNAIDRVNIQYDVETDHGVTQGAVFP